MRYLLPLLLLGCYGTEYLPYPLDFVDTTGWTTVWGQETQHTAQDMENILLEFRMRLEIQGTEIDHDCLQHVDILIPSSFEETAIWCDREDDIDSVMGCMVPHPSWLGYEGSHPNAWVLVLRPDHAAWGEGLRGVLQHELVHMILWCNTGHADHKHTSHLYP